MSVPPACREARLQRLADEFMTALLATAIPGAAVQIGSWAPAFLVEIGAVATLVFTGVLAAAAVRNLLSPVPAAPPGSRLRRRGRLRRLAVYVAILLLIPVSLVQALACAVSLILILAIDGPEPPAG